ncbi:c-type cytochrome [Aurantivibrio plasticivorans]
MKNVFKPALLLMGALSMAQGAAAQGDAAAGEPLTAVCAACHGADGNSLAPIYPSLAGLGEKYLTKQLQDIKSGERAIPEMTGLLANMSDQDLANVAAFYDSKPAALTGAKEMTVRVNSGADVDALRLGEQLYRYGNPESGVAACTGCHSPTGQGNDPAGYPRLGGQHADYVVKQLESFRDGVRVNDGNEQTMRGVAKHLSNAEIQAVANYIAGLN